MSVTIYRLLSSTAAVAIIALAAPVGAQSPQSPTVASGSVSVTRQGATTVVTQGTEKGIIDWRSFSIGSNEAVRFEQPGRSSITLNRVTGSELSRIDGNLSATGQVWLANPNGVLIGPGGQVNVGGLLATTGRIDAQEFLRSGRAQIDQIGKDAAIINGGTINILDGGYAALAAASIRNDGIVAARSGTVAFGAGKAATVDFTGDKLITFQVTQALDEAPAGADALISNAGTIAAQGGVVLLSARAAKGVMDNVVNLSGHVISNRVRVDGGTVIFGDGGAVQVSAKVDASSATAQGGKVELLGEKVGLMDRASIDASGATGGGTVLVGGDWQGGGERRNAQVAYVAPTASINVDATQSGNGGKVVVWADGVTRFQGSITARGGVNGGDGGRVETSGKRALVVGSSASVNAGARAAKAKPGSWLLDPNDITISASADDNISAGPVFSASTDAPSTVSVATLNAALANGDVTVQTTSAYAGSGDITFSGGTISYSGASARSLTLAAYRDILIQNGATISLSGAAHSVTLNARNEDSSGSLPGAILVDAGALIETTGGSIALVGGAGGAGYARGGGSQAEGVAIGGVLSAGGGQIIISGYSPNSSGVLISGQLLTSDGAITINGDGGTAAVNLNGAISASGTGAVTLTGVRGSGPGSTNIRLGPSASITTASGALTLNGQSTLNGSSYDNHGVVISSGATLGTVDGAIVVNGSGAAAGGPNIGVVIGGESSATLTATGAGSIAINGLGGGGGVDIASSGVVVSANTGDITLTANSYSLNSASFASSKGATRFQPTGTDVSVGVGAGSGLGTLQIGQGLIDSVSGKLIIGRGDLAAAITLSPGFTLNNDLTLLTGSGAVIVAGAVDSGETAKSLTVMTATGDVSFAGVLGSGTPLSSLAVTRTSYGGSIILPTLSTGDLTISVESTTVNQSGDMTVTGTALLSTGYNGQIYLQSYNNTIGTLRVYSANSTISVVGDFALGASTVGSLNLYATGVVTQTAPLSAGGLAVNGSSTAVYNLTDPGNALNLLVGTAGSITIVNGPTSSLAVTDLGAHYGLTLSQAGENRSIGFIGSVNAHSGTANFTAEGTIQTGTFSFLGSGATINLSVGGVGSAVNVQAGNTVNVLAGVVSINAPTTPSQPSTPSVPSTASNPPTPTEASTPTVASVPTIATTPTVASVPTITPTVASIAATPSSFSVASTPTQASAPAPIILIADPIAVFDDPANSDTRNSILAQILPPPVNFDLAPPPPPIPSPPVNNAGLVASIPSGALIPMGQGVVPGSGARLANTQTIKVDGADTGGVGGQVIAGVASQGGSEPVVPGLVSLSPSGGPNLPRAEPPLAQQPSTLNEESLLD